MAPRARSALSCRRSQRPRAAPRYPADALVVAGQTCPAVELTRRLALADPSWPGAPPRWQRVCPGWGWPADLERRLDDALASGRVVVVDDRPGAWLGPRQERVHAQVERWLAGRAHPRLVVWR
ncbi:MAG: hypothetical protein R3A48_16440 [Polyangiales bacterium]